MYSSATCMLMYVANPHTHIHTIVSPAQDHKIILPSGHMIFSLLPLSNSIPIQQYTFNCSD